MKKLLFAIAFLSCSTILMAQDDINLLDFVNEQNTTMQPQTKKATEVSTAVPSDSYDWRMRRHSLSLSAGTPSLLSGTTGFFTGLIGAFEEGTKTHIYGTYGIHYGYNVLKWLRVGGSVMYSGWRTETEYSSGNIHTDRNDELQLMGQVDFTYLNRRKVKLYSGIGVGANMTFYNMYANGQPIEEDDAHRMFTPIAAWNVTALGVEFGGERVFGLTEINFGFADVLRVGIGVRL